MLQFETNKRTAVHNPLFMRWQNLEIYTCHVKDWYLFDVSFSPFGKVGRSVACYACRALQSLRTTPAHLVTMLSDLASHYAKLCLPSLCLCPSTVLSGPQSTA